MSSRILIIEDEPGIVDFVERGLRAQGFEVATAADGDTGIAKARNEPVDLVVLDIMLPGRSGWEVLEVLHEHEPVLPVIVLTALGEVEDRVSGLDAGAVDYVTKPFSLAELVARIRAHLRIAAHTPQMTLSAGDIEINLLSREVRRDGELVRLSTTEFELLVYLMRNRRQVLSREQILRAVWGYEHDPGTNVVDVYIGYLRRKLRRRRTSDSPGSATDQGPSGGADGDSISPVEAAIVTVRSIGYRLDAAD
ncbi:MAG: response regulator transcription factor [Actinomycetota bacterium]|nr:response regulator transcription factor [Actinomycetota bacterium]